MDHLDYPPKDLWECRRNWFQSMEQLHQGNGSYFLSEQACALTAEVQSAFCAGAWVAVVVMAVAVVDASIRETELPEFKGNSKSLFEKVNANPELQELRKKRNTYVHIDLEAPAITVEQQWSDRDRLEGEARAAVKLMFEAFYMSPWV